MTDIFQLKNYKDSWSPDHRIDWPEEEKEGELLRAWPSMEGDFITFQTYPIVKITPCGVQILVYGEEKFVNLQAKKKWATTTAKEALNQLYYRQLSWRKRIQENRKRNENVIALIKADMALSKTV